MGENDANEQVDDDAKEQGDDDAKEHVGDDDVNEQMEDVETNLTGVNTIVDKVSRDQRESSVPKVVEAEFHRCENEEMERCSWT